MMKLLESQQRVDVMSPHPKIFSQFDSLRLDLPHSLPGKTLGQSVLCRHPRRGI